MTRAEINIDRYICQRERKGREEEGERNVVQLNYTRPMGQLVPELNNSWKKSPGEMLG